MHVFKAVDLPRVLNGDEMGKYCPVCGALLENCFVISTDTAGFLLPGKKPERWQPNVLPFVTFINF